MEAPKIIMVTARYLQELFKRRLENQQQKLQAESKAEGKAEGQAQERQLWLDLAQQVHRSPRTGFALQRTPSRRGADRLLLTAPENRQPSRRPRVTSCYPAKTTQPCIVATFPKPGISVPPADPPRPRPLP